MRFGDRFCHLNVKSLVLGWWRVQVLSLTFEDFFRDVNNLHFFSWWIRIKAYRHWILLWAHVDLKDVCNKLENQFNTFKWISTCRKLQAIQSKDRRYRPKCPRLYLNSILCCSIKCILILPVPWLYISATFWFGNKSALCAFLGFGDILSVEDRPSVCK